jgi:hypothetical protein
VSGYQLQPFSAAPSWRRRCSAVLLLIWIPLDELHADVCLELGQVPYTARSPEALPVSTEVTPQPSTLLCREPVQRLRGRRCWAPSAAGRVLENPP